MPNYSSSAIDPGKVALAVSKSSVGLSGTEVAMIEKVVSGVNGGYALGDITRSGSIDSSDITAWLRVETGLATQEELDRSYEIRTEISRQYSLNRVVDLPVLLMVDLDIDLIIKALEWWLDYGVFTNDFSWNVSSNPYADVMMAMSDSYSLGGGLKRSWHLIDWNTGVTRQQAIINNIAAWKQLYSVDVASTDIVNGYKNSMFIVWQWWHYFGRNDNGFGVRNPAIARPTSIRSNRIRTLERTSVPTKTTIVYEIIGGGGSGAGGYYGTGSGNPGTPTSLYDSSQNLFAISYGGAGGTQPAPYSGSFRTSQAGFASYYGSGGAGGANSDSNNQTAGRPAPSTSYGAGGGGGGAHPFSANNGGGGGRAATRETGAFAMNPNSVLSITVGQGGTKPGGGTGAGGYVKLTINGVEYEYTSIGTSTLTIPESTSGGSSSVGSGEALTKVRSLWKPKFTTDFRYMKKDPNGQFVASGLTRCPTFAGSNSNGYIPDNTNKGFGQFTIATNSFDSNNPNAPGHNTPYIQFATSFNSSTYTYKVRQRILHDIRVKPTGHAGTDILPSYSYYTNQSFTIKVRGWDENGNARTLANGSTVYNQSQYGSLSNVASVTNNYVVFHQGALTFGWQTDSNGNPIPANPGEDVYYHVYFPSSLEQFIETLPNGERWIRKGIIEQEIPGDWYTKPVYVQGAYSSSASYSSGGLRASMSITQIYPTTDSEGKPIYIRLLPGFHNTVMGEIPATNFDFAETA